MACIEIGTFWIFSERRVAVTVTSARPIEPESLSSAAGCSAAVAAKAVPPNMAATAYETFDFILDPSPVRRPVRRRDRVNSIRFHDRLLALDTTRPSVRLNGRAIRLLWLRLLEDARARGVA